MTETYLYKLFFKQNLYSDMEIIINDKKYKLHTLLLKSKSEFFKCLLNNPQMNITDPIIITGLNNKVIKSDIIDEVIKYMYLDDINKILYLNNEIDYDYNFKYLLDYYFVSDYLQINDIKNVCIDKMNKYFIMIYNYKKVLIDLSNEVIKCYDCDDSYFNRNNRYIFNINNNRLDIENRYHYNKNISSILDFITKHFIKFNNYLKLINIKLYDIIKFRYIAYFKYENKSVIGYFSEHFKNFILNDLDTKYLNYFINEDKYAEGQNLIKEIIIFFENFKEYIIKTPIHFTKPVILNFHDINILLKKNDTIQNTVLIKLLDCNELIVDNTIINEKTQELEKICNNYSLKKEYISKMKYLLDFYDEKCNKL